LSDLTKELAIASEVENLQFTLQGPGGEADIKFSSSDELQFKGMKRIFNRVIRSCISNYSGESAIFMIEIHLLGSRNQSIACGSDELVLDW
jgi:hypothetical protein